MFSDANLGEMFSAWVVYLC